MQDTASSINDYRDSHYQVSLRDMFTAMLGALEWEHVPTVLERTAQNLAKTSGMDEVMQRKADALTEAYDKFADAIYRHCYFRVFRRERAEELVQETFIKAWKYLLSGNEVKNLRAFLYRVVNNLIIDESRKKKEASLEALQESGVEFGYHQILRWETNIDAANVVQALTALSESHRTVIIMRYIDELQPEEIARITGESPNTISVRLHRAIERLREQFRYD